MAFIIDRYNKYDQWDRAHARYKFELNGVWYAIMEVELEWGLPQLPLRISGQSNPQYYQIYNTEADAMEFIRQIRALN